MDLSIVVPCYKEESIIERTVFSLSNLFHNFASSFSFEIILVVEKSESMTLPIAKSLMFQYDNLIVLENDKCYGKGYSVKKGVLATKGKLVLVVDADLPVDLDKYSKIMLWLIEHERTGAVYFTAFGDKSDPRKRGLLRSQMTFGLFALRNLLLKQSISDTQLGCKLYIGNIARQLFEKVQERGFLYELEMTDLISRAGYFIEECAVRIPEFSKESSVNLKQISVSVYRFVGYCLRRRRMSRQLYSQSVLGTIELKEKYDSGGTL